MMGNKPQIIAGGGVIYRQINEEPEVLLIFRKGIWDLPKGKLDVGEDIETCAVREVKEETGNTSVAMKFPLLQTRHQYSWGGEVVEKVTWWYAMTISNDVFSPETEEDITDVRWVPLKVAIEKVGYDNLRTVLLDLQEKLNSRK